ncbi:MAG: T9SS type A sorting domain-containing protein, partial [Ignavibacteria bacterium]|nr:T9SS type A sorting domain-containing protein [Ignavibacteria bacterium]
ALNSISEKISGWDGNKFSLQAGMNPFDGYYFYNSRNLKSLRLPYKPVTLQLAAASGLLKQAHTSYPDTNSITISLMDQNQLMSHLVIGWDKNSLDDYDSLDLMAPPGDFEEAGLRIVNRNLSTGWKELFAEFRNSIGQGQKFTIKVKNSTKKAMHLMWQGTDKLKDYEIYLLDKRLNKLYNMKEETEMQLPSYVQMNEYELLIGNSSFIEKEKDKLLPQEYRLFQNYPNPFNPATLIKYSLPRDAFVTLRVYDMLGRVVKEIVNGFNEKGFHEIIFDAGTTIASGVYFYSMEAKDLNGTTAFHEAKKMLLIK